MLVQDLTTLYRKTRLLTYQSMFGRIRERDGSLSATEAYAVDVIFLLGNPTITQLAETLGISQPNATYKVNNLVNKGYVTKTVSEDDKRECRLTVSDRFYKYFDDADVFVQSAVDIIAKKYTPEELEKFDTMVRELTEAVNLK